VTFRGNKKKICKETENMIEPKLHELSLDVDLILLIPFAQTNNKQTRHGLWPFKKKISQTYDV
jgi:hypothetical protein